MKMNFLPPSMVWTVLFVPALCYFLISRLGHTSTAYSSMMAASHVYVGLASAHWQEEGEEERETMRRRRINSVLFLSSSSSSAPSSVSQQPQQQKQQQPSNQQDYAFGKYQLQHPLLLVQPSGLEHIVASLWKHDSELGRGYLLMSSSRTNTSGGGRIWRWEVGGGPIAIGKTLYMEPSGCRSNLWEQCTAATNTSGDNDGTVLPTGSGPLTVDFSHSNHASEGRLIVAEYGERRIVRIEENGARTPLILQVPPPPDCHSQHGVGREVVSSSWQRLDRPTHLLMTPFGDLLVLSASQDDKNNNTFCHAIYRLRQAVHVEPLQSMLESRLAHRWKNVTHDDRLETVYHGTAVGSMALDHSWTDVYLTVLRKEEDAVWLVRISILDDDDEEEHDGSQDENSDGNTSHAGDSPQKEGWNGRETFVSNLSAMGVTTVPVALAVDRKGHIFVGTSNQGVLVFDKSGTWLMMLPVDAAVTSLTVGEDGYLYVTTSNQLLRIRVRNGPVVVPTNLLPKQRKRSATKP